VRDLKERTWHDLPWAAHPVIVVYQQRRVQCRRCGIRTERIEFADPKAQVTRRLQQLIGIDCQSMPTSLAAVRHTVSWGAARRAEVAFLRRWDQQRPKRRPRNIGLDEIQRGKGQRFWTVLSGCRFSEGRDPVFSKPFPPDLSARLSAHDVPSGCPKQPISVYTFAS
jgi:transposase